LLSHCPKNLYLLSPLLQNKNINKFMAMEKKQPLPPYPIALWGEGGAFPAVLKICSIKKVNCRYVIITSTLKISYLKKTPKTKQFVKIFFEAF
jgi:hypothetical protein